MYFRFLSFPFFSLIRFARGLSFCWSFQGTSLRFAGYSFFHFLAFNFSFYLYQIPTSLQLFCRAARWFPGYCHSSVILASAFTSRLAPHVAARWRLLTFETACFLVHTHQEKVTVSAVSFWLQILFIYFYNFLIEA